VVLVHINMWNQYPRRQDKVQGHILSTLLLHVIKQERGTVAKANRIVNGQRNHNVPVDMSDNFFDNGNETCKYLITDPRSDKYLTKPAEKKSQKEV